MPTLPFQAIWKRRLQLAVLLTFNIWHVVVASRYPRSDPGTYNVLCFVKVRLDDAKADFVIISIFYISTKEHLLVHCEKLLVFVWKGGARQERIFKVKSKGERIFYHVMLLYFQLSIDCSALCLKCPGTAGITAFKATGLTYGLRSQSGTSVRIIVVAECVAMFQSSTKTLLCSKQNSMLILSTSTMALDPFTFKTWSGSSRSAVKRLPNCSDLKNLVVE